MYQLHFLQKENDLNKIIKRHKREQYTISILFVSLWDVHCQGLVAKLVEKYGDSTKGEPLYIVDSFHMPHSFVIYETTKLPHLVKLRKDRVVSQDYLPLVMKRLKVV
jgi:hypothetical protein